MCAKKRGLGISLNLSMLILKSEVYAAREKNGIYIPRDRYLQDEAEKKVSFTITIDFLCHL